MAKHKAIILYTVIAVLAACTDAHADLKTLMKVGQSQAEIAKSLKEETKNYNRVKEAIIGGELKEGMPADKITKRYGKPVIDIYDKKRNAYKWVYMPATSTHFEGEKLYLFVDENDTLVGWKLIEQEGEE